jgi:hypothetical protein
MKTLAAGAVPVVGAMRASGRTTTRSEIHSHYPVEGKFLDEWTGPHPDFGLATKAYHTYGGYIWYWGAQPRPHRDQWAHLFSLVGIGQAGVYNSYWESKSEATAYPDYAVHAIKADNWDSYNTGVWTPDKYQHDNSLGATPAGDGPGFSRSERAANITEAVLGLVPGIGDMQTVDTIMRNLVYDPNSGPSGRLFNWDVREWSTESVNQTTHYAELEVRSPPTVRGISGSFGSFSERGSTFGHTSEAMGGGVGFPIIPNPDMDPDSFVSGASTMTTTASTQFDQISAPSGLGLVDSNHDILMPKDVDTNSSTNH